MLRIQGSIYFGAVEHVRDHLHAVDEINPQRKTLLLFARGVSFIDLAGAELLGEEARRRRALGGGLYLVGAPSAVQIMLRRTAQLDTLGADHIVVHKHEALHAAYHHLDSEVCRRCSLRVFEECQVTLPNGEVRQPVPNQSI